MLRDVFDIWADTVAVAMFQRLEHRQANRHQGEARRCGEQSGTRATAPALRIAERRAGRASRLTAFLSLGLAR